MAELTTSGVVRDILTRDPNMDTDEVIRLAKRRGLTVPDEKIRHSIHNQRNAIRSQVAGTVQAVKVVPAAAHETVKPKAAQDASAVSVATTATSGLAGVFANVALVNKVLDLSGGLENTRAVAEAVRACGSVDAFLQHVDLVAGIRSDKSA